MSQCPHCFVGQCQRHKLQDHGKRELLLKSKMIDPKAAQKRLFDRVVTQQLDKLEAAARGANAEEQVDERVDESCCCCVFVLEEGCRSCCPLLSRVFSGKSPRPRWSI